MLRMHLPQAGVLDCPCQVGAHQSIILGAVDGELLAVGISEFVLMRALQNKLRCLVEFWSCRHAMQTRQVAEVLVGGRAARLISQRGPLSSAEEWPLAKSIERSEEN